MHDKQRKAMFAKLGRGARVKSSVILGGQLKDIPKGSHGTVIDYFGTKRNPIVKFDNNRHIVVEDAKGLELLKGKKVTDFNVIKSNGSVNQLKNKLISSGFNDGGDNYVYDIMTLTNENGSTDSIPYSIELSRNRARVNLKKGDVPHRWRGMFDDIQEEIEDKVKGALR